MEIHGLDHLINLKALDLKCNQITEIQGLNHLVNLKTLDLYKNEYKNGCLRIYYLSRLSKRLLAN